MSPDPTAGQRKAFEAYYEMESATQCRARLDGDCSWIECPQVRDGEPHASHRHCPLDLIPFTADREDPPPVTTDDQSKENTMTTPTTISIDGTDYVRADSITTNPPHDSEVRIVVLQRGWVVVGQYAEDGDRVLLSNAHVIERWGTTEGLGQLVTGPTSATRLRRAGSVEAHRLGVVLTIACEGDEWSL